MCRKLLANTVIENFRIERLNGMKSAVIVFPGSNCDRDLAVALERVTGRKPTMVWHREANFPTAPTSSACLAAFPTATICVRRDGGTIADHAGVADAAAGACRCSASATASRC